MHSTLRSGVFEFHIGGLGFHVSGFRGLGGQASRKFVTRSSGDDKRRILPRRRQLFDDST